MPGKYDIMELQEIGNSVGLEKEDFVARLRDMYLRPILAVRHWHTSQRIAVELNLRE